MFDWIYYIWIKQLPSDLKEIVEANFVLLRIGMGMWENNCCFKDRGEFWEIGNN